MVNADSDYDYDALLTALRTSVLELGVEVDIGDQVPPPDRAFGLLNILAALATRYRLAIADDIGFSPGQQCALILQVFDTVSDHPQFRLNAALDLLAFVITLCGAQAEVAGDAAHEALRATTSASATLLTSILFSEGMVRTLGDEPVVVPPAPIMLAESRTMLRAALARLDALALD